MNTPVVVRANWDGTVTGWLYRPGVEVDAASGKLRYLRGVFKPFELDIDFEVEAVRIRPRTWPSGVVSYSAWLRGEGETYKRAFSSLKYVEARRAAEAIADGLGIAFEDETDGLLIDRLGPPAGVDVATGEVALPADGALDVAVVPGEVRCTIPPRGILRIHWLLLPVAVFVGPAIAGLVAWRSQTLPVDSDTLRLVQAALVLGALSLGPVAAVVAAMVRSATRRQEVVCRPGEVTFKAAGQTISATRDRVEHLDVLPHEPQLRPTSPLATPVLRVTVNTGSVYVGHGLRADELEWLRGLTIASLRQPE